MPETLPAFDPSKPSTRYVAPSSASPTSQEALPPFDPSKPSETVRAPEQAPPTQPSTTAGGIAGSLTRGLAPYAAGAGVGAALGAPFGGVMAVPGALAGMGAVGLTQLSEDAYNWAGKHLGLPHATTPQDLVDKLADALGVKKPNTPIEHMAQDVSAALGGFTWGGLGEAILAGRADTAERFIKNAYVTAVKPTGMGKLTAPTLQGYKDQARSAINSIVANKANLRLAEKSGELVEGELPKNLEQFGEAIDQTKRALFERYNLKKGMAEQAGVAVSLKPTVTELRKLGSSAPLLGDHPQIAKYANDWADRLEAIGTYSPSDAQDAIQRLNSSLKAFYARPDYGSATYAAVDAMVANTYRNGLDRAVSSAVGPGYQALKNEYGALRAIENHVMHRAFMQASRDPGGGVIANMLNAVSAEEVMRGIVTLNPAAFTRGVFLRTTTALVRKMRDPNPAIAKIFKSAERYQQEAPPPQLTQPPLALPPPTMTGPQQPWIGTGTGVMPPQPRGFTTPQPPTTIP